MSIPSGSTYANILHGYFGDHSAEEQNILWLKFLEQHKATSENPPPVSDFVSYVAEVYSSEQSDQALETKIIWSICDILLLLISKIVKTQINTQAAVSFLTEYQKAYQDEMSRTFFYSAGDPVDKNLDQASDFSPDARGTPTVATPSNIDTWDLGYGNVTVGEYAKWLYEKVAAAPAGSAAQSIEIPTKTFTWKLAWPPFGGFQTNTKTGAVEMQCSRDSNNTFTLTINAKTRYVQTFTDALTGTNSDVTTPHLTTGTVSVPTSEDYASFKSTFQTLFVQAYNAAKPDDTRYQAVEPSWRAKVVSRDAIDYNYELCVPWASKVKFNYTGTNEKAKNDYSLAIKSRGERNRAMQNFVDAIKTKKDILGDKREQIVNMSDTLISGRKQISNILQTIVRQLQTITESIYK